MEKVKPPMADKDKPMKKGEKKEDKMMKKPFGPKKK